MSFRTKLDLIHPSPKWMRYLSGFLGLFIGAMLAKITVKGRQHIPKKGPFIIASNHFNLIDAFFIVYALRRPIVFLAGSDQIIDWFNIWAVWLYGFIPTNRTRLAPSTIKMASKSLKEGEILGIFPEGTIEGKGLRKPKPGVVYFSTMDKVSILPVSIYGLHESFWRYLIRGVRPKVVAQIGKPFGPYSLPNSKGKKEEILKVVGDKMMCRIAALLPSETHGIYTNDPSIEKYKQENNAFSH